MFILCSSSPTVNSLSQGSQGANSQAIGTRGHDVNSISRLSTQDLPSGANLKLRLHKGMGQLAFCNDLAPFRRIQV